MATVPATVVRTVPAERNTPLLTRDQIVDFTRQFSAPNIAPPNWQRAAGSATNPNGPIALPGMVNAGRMFDSATRIAASRDGTERTRAFLDAARTVALQSQPIELVVHETPGNGERQSTATAATAGAAGAPAGGDCCCPCWREMWAAVERFFKMIGEWFMNLFCPSGAKLLQRNEKVNSLFSAHSSIGPDRRDVEEAFKSFSEREQLRIAEDAHKNLLRGDSTQQALPPEAARDWLLSNDTNLVHVLGRLLDSANTPSSPLANARPAANAAASLAPLPEELPLAYAKRLLASNEALTALLSREEANAPTNEELRAALGTMSEEHQKAIAFEACTVCYGAARGSHKPEDAFNHLKTMNSPMVRVLKALQNAVVQPPAAPQPSSSAAAASSEETPLSRAQRLLAGNERLTALIKRNGDPNAEDAPSKVQLVEAFRKMSTADQEAVAVQAYNAYYGSGGESLSNIVGRLLEKESNRIIRMLRALQDEVPAASSVTADRSKSDG